jgi:hypothetical protein
VRALPPPACTLGRRPAAPGTAASTPLPLPAPLLCRPPLARVRRGGDICAGGGKWGGAGREPRQRRPRRGEPQAEPRGQPSRRRRWHGAPSRSPRAAVAAAAIACPCAGLCALDPRAAAGPRPPCGGHARHDPEDSPRHRLSSCRPAAAWWGSGRTDGSDRRECRPSSNDERLSGTQIYVFPFPQRVPHASLYTRVPQCSAI